MEPLSAVGLASSIAQFLDFGVKVFNATKEISKNGSDASVIHLTKLSTDLDELSTSLVDHYHPFEQRPLSEEERGLIEVAQQCRGISDEVQEYIAGLVLRPEDEDDKQSQEGEPYFTGTGVSKDDEIGENNIGSELRVAKERLRARLNRSKIALKTIWKKSDIEELRKRQADFRSQLALRLLFVLNSYQIRQTSTLEDIRGKSNEIIEAIALHSLGNNANSDASAAILTTRGGAQPTILLPASTSHLAKFQQNSKGKCDFEGDESSQYQSAMSFTNEGSTAPAGYSTHIPGNCSRLILNALHFRSIDQRQEAISHVHQKTFDWILEPKETGSHDGLLEWLSQGSGLFWVSGKAGSGKSSLFKFLVGEDRFYNAVRTWASSGGKAQLCLGTFYFWYAGTTLQKSHEGLLRGLLYQILSARPGLELQIFPQLCRHILTGRVQSQPDLTEVELRNAFGRLVDVIPDDMRICFVIDGLDEYTGELNGLCDLFNRVTQSSSVKILLSSRPIPVSCERFALCPQLCLQDLTRPDILKYVEDHLCNNNILQSMEEVECGITHKLVNIITERACGVFLWVVLVVRIITQRLQNYDNVPELLEEIDNLPADLEQLYDRMLSDIDAKYRVQCSKYLQLAILSFSFSDNHSMTAVQMYFAEDEDYERILSTPMKPLSRKRIKWIDKSVEGRLRSRCCGLLELHGPYVELLHRTVVEFLQLGSNWQKIQALTRNTKFNPEQALLYSTLAEIQVAYCQIDPPGSVVRGERKDELDLCLSKLFIYEAKVSHSLRQKFYEKYLPALDRVLPKLGPDAPSAGAPERDALVEQSCDQACSRLRLDDEERLFMRCALSSPGWYLPPLGVLHRESQQDALWSTRLLIHFVETKDGLIRRRILDALRIVDFCVLAPEDLRANLRSLFTDRWHGCRVVTSWEFVLRYVLAITTSWSPPDFFSFQDPQVVLAILCLVQSMLSSGADVNCSIAGYHATVLLTKLVSSVQFHVQLSASDHGAYMEEISSVCDKIEEYVHLRKDLTGSNVQVPQPAEGTRRDPSHDNSIPQPGKMPRFRIKANLLCLFNTIKGWKQVKFVAFCSPYFGPSPQAQPVVIDRRCHHNNMVALATPPPKDPALEKDFRFMALGIPCEWAESYHPQGLHPVHFGDVLHGRYQVIRKLGNGSFATAWLALDSTSASRYVALKIQVAGLDEGRQREIALLLASQAPRDQSSRYLVTLLDSFTHKGPNGSHSCLVLEAMGPSVSSILNAPQQIYDPLNPPVRRFPKDRVKRILRQVLQGLDFLHRNGVVHADLQSGNMLFAIKDLASVDAESLRQTPENSQVEFLERVDGQADLWAPKYLAVAMPLSDYVLEGDDELVKITDLGGAFFESEPPQTVVTPTPLRAPEIILGCPLGKGIDVWSFGCLLFELLTGMPLFQVPTVMRKDETIHDDHLILLTDIIGPLPGPLLSRWSRANLYYGPNGERLEVRPDDFETYDASEGAYDGYRSGDDEDYDEFLDDGMEDYSVPEIGPPKPFDPLEAYFRTHKPPEIDEEEEKVIVSMLRHIFRYDPSERPSVADLLKHRWFVT